MGILKCPAAFKGGLEVVGLIALQAAVCVKRPGFSSDCGAGSVWEDKERRGAGVVLQA